MKQPLFRKFMDSYIPEMKRWYGWDAKFIGTDEIVFYEEDSPACLERCKIDHEWAGKLNQKTDRHVCVLREIENRTIVIITEKDNQILYISGSISRDMFQYGYRKRGKDTSLSVDLAEKAVLDNVFDVFRDMYENEPKNRLLFVTGQLRFYRG